MSNYILMRSECLKNSEHWFVPYNKGNMICLRCGRFAKVGQMYYPNINIRDKKIDN